VGAHAMGRNSTLVAIILHAFLSRNLDQSMLKNAYFLEKNCKNCLSVPNRRLPPAAGSSAPRTPALIPDPAY